MSNYPEAVAAIANDYLERVTAQLRLVPPRERDEFLREIESHIYEAYQQTPGEDDIARILAVLRNLGEPAEVVADRLPGAMVASGTKRNLPLYIVGGIFIALFGIPLGFGGIGVLVGLLCALAGLLIAYFATAGSLLLVGALFMLFGLIRFAVPPLWDKLVLLGVIQMNGPPAEFLDHFSPSDQGLMMILLASLIVGAGLGMLWVGKHMFRGLRFLSSLAFDLIRRFAQGARRKLRRDPREANPLSPFLGPNRAHQQADK
jgi:uncharacterized membrane protein